MWADPDEEDHAGRLASPDAPCHEGWDGGEVRVERSRWEALAEQHRPVVEAAVRAGAPIDRTVDALMPVIGAELGVDAALVLDAALRAPLGEPQDRPGTGRP